MLKASAGGGGKGIRVARTHADLKSAYDTASGEAQANFGDGRLYIERYVENPRHIEVQILGDTQGNVVHLFERECSIQRRHQKLIEEAPSFFLDPQTREKICNAARDLAQKVGYINAGTVEFLVDDQKNFFFCEMNPRIQVEHPVTEQVTGIDLVCEQIKIADGDPIYSCKGMQSNVVSMQKIRRGILHLVRDISLQCTCLVVLGCAWILRHIRAIPFRHFMTA